MDSKLRFSSVVDYYVKYRPDYPVQVIYFLKKNLLLDSDFTVADIGSGTGKSSLLFLPHVKQVFGVEPNDEMRAAAEKLFAGQRNFASIKGTAENTGLEDTSVDIVVAGQAFHWFDPEKARKEFRRILKQNRPVLLLFYNRDDEASNFMKAYNDYLKIYSKPGSFVDHRESVDPLSLDKFYENGYETVSFKHTQTFDFEGLKGRYLSCSYAIDPGLPRHEEAIEELKALYQRFEYRGEVIMNYRVLLHYGLFNKRQLPLWKKTIYHLLRIPAFFAYLFLLSAMFFSSLFKKLKKKIAGK